MRRFLAPIVLIVLALPAPAQAAGPGGAAYSSDAVALTSSPNGFVGRFKRLTGTAPAASPVVVERYDEIGSQWAPIAYATSDENGVFATRWRPDRAGDQRLRARVNSNAAQAATAQPDFALTVFSPATATWYGPGFYGHQTACGQKMSRTLLGVAHRRLPCGTQVTVFYKGQSITVPVVDRGPFANGAKWDLTAATAQQLGFTGTDTIGALRR